MCSLLVMSAPTCWSSDPWASVSTCMHAVLARVGQASLAGARNERLFSTFLRGSIGGGQLSGETPQEQSDNALSRTMTLGSQELPGSLGRGLPALPSVLVKNTNVLSGLCRHEVAGPQLFVRTHPGVCLPRSHVFPLYCDTPPLWYVGSARARTRAFLVLTLGCCDT